MTSFFWENGGCGCGSDSCEGCEIYEKHRPSVKVPTRYERILARDLDGMAYFIVETEKNMFDYLAGRFSNQKEFREMLEPDWIHRINQYIEYLKERECG